MKRASQESLLEAIKVCKVRKEEIKDEIALLKSKVRCFPILQDLEEAKDLETIYVTSWNHFEEMEEFLPSGIIFENSIQLPFHLGKAFERRHGTHSWVEWDDHMPHTGLCVNKEPLSEDIQNEFRLKFHVEWVPKPDDTPDADKWDNGKRVCGTFFQRVGFIGGHDIIHQFIKKCS